MKPVASAAGGKNFEKPQRCGLPKPHVVNNQNSVVGQRPFEVLAVERPVHLLVAPTAQGSPNAGSARIRLEPAPHQWRRKDRAVPRLLPRTYPPAWCRHSRSAQWSWRLRCVSIRRDHAATGGRGEESRDYNTGPVFGPDLRAARFQRRPRARPRIVELDFTLNFFCSIFAPLTGAMEQIVETGCVSIAVC